VRLAELGRPAGPREWPGLLVPIFGDRLLFPRVFAGAGDMRRGALMLRAAASGEELEYTRPGTCAAAPRRLPPRAGQPPVGGVGGG
jgi:hypothetical protein